MTNLDTAKEFAERNTIDNDGSMFDAHGNVVPNEAAEEIIFWRSSAMQDDLLNKLIEKQRLEFLRLREVFAAIEQLAKTELPREVAIRCDCNNSQHLIARAACPVHGGNMTRLTNLNMKPNTFETLGEWKKICNLEELIERLMTARDIANQNAFEIDVNIDTVRLEAECLSDGSIVYNVEVA